jgi:hypothetical protein
MQESLWNPKYQHFMDRFSAKYPEKYFQFASGPEEAGFVPWYFDLPDAQYAVAWKSVMDPKKFYAPFGPRTILPDHPQYMVQHRTPGAQPGECEWNGPSWPFLTCMVLGGMANLLDNQKQDYVTREDYFKLLKNYTLSQYKDGRPYIAEDLNPDTGQWIADFPGRSEDYNHSTYNDLIITGLAGLRPRPDNTLEVSPLIPEAMSYLYLRDIPYHSRGVSILWDKDNHFGKGKGLRVFVDGVEKAAGPSLSRLMVDLP